MKRFLPILLLSSLAAACGVDFPPEEIVEKPRPLGSTVTIEGDTTFRATPKPGETATYEMLVANPGPRVGWAYDFVVCPLQRTAIGVAFCDTSLSWWLIKSEEHPTVSTASPIANPTITFTVPDEATLGNERDELLVQGVMCPGDLDPTVIAALASADFATLRAIPNPCTDKSRNGLFVASPIPLERSAADENHTPMILGTDFDGQPWTFVPDDDFEVLGCKGMGYPEIDQTTDYYDIDVALDPSSRETYSKPSLVPSEPPTEVTDDPHLIGRADAGNFDIRFDNQRTDGQVLELTWQPPQPSVDPTGRLVRFWFVVHDDRLTGDREATSWAVRALCVVPSVNP